MANERREFTINRGDGRGFERTVVGITGIEHGPYAARKKRAGRGHGRQGRPLHRRGRVPPRHRAGG